MIQATGQFDGLLADRFAADLLDDGLVIWRQIDGWQPTSSELPDGTGLPHRYAGMSRILDAAVRSGRPLLQYLDERHLVWAVPISDSRPAAVAVRVCGADPDELMRLLSRTTQAAWQREQELRQAAQTIRQQEMQLTDFAAQVSESMEELTWLRRLASNLELSESGNQTEQIAENVLPGLCELIGANTLAFLRDNTEESRDYAGPAIWQTGRYRVPHQVCLEIIYELSGRNRGGPVIVNNWDSRFRGEGFLGIRSCVLVPVATRSLRLGWLIAINKDITRRLRMHSHALEDGGADAADFGSFEASLMTATAVILAAHGRNCSLFQEKELLLRGVIRSLINAIDAKDSYTCGHSDRVAEVARLIARALSLDPAECERVYMTGLLHDVGKIGVPDFVLQKPGRLTEEEFALIRQHPVIGYEILKHLDNFRYVLPGVLHHHEAIDGSGYPHGLKGSEIPLVARILAVADAYDAMTTDRPYRRGMPSEKAEQILRNGVGKQWDGDCVDAFFRSIHGIRLIAAQQSLPVTSQSHPQ